jgi:hypothetical protein
VRRRHHTGPHRRGDLYPSQRCASHYKRDILVVATEIDTQAIDALVAAMRSGGNGPVSGFYTYLQPTCSVSIAASPTSRRSPRKPPLGRTTATADWQFTTADARIKLKRLYPTL